jgi:ferredoxin
LSSVKWLDKIHFHFTDEGTRANLSAILREYKKNYNVYTCGPNNFMNSVIEAAQTAGFPENARHLEYFTAPEVPEYDNYAFKVILTKSKKEFDIPADRTVTDILMDNGIHVDMKCTNGICGVCKCGLISGNVEHRDFVLSKKQRENTIILCQSRALMQNGIIEIDL